MVALVVLAALALAMLVGGLIGSLSRWRGGAVPGHVRRGLDDPSVGAQAGFTNQGPQL